MRITLINQAFYPDVVSTGQHLTDLALGLAAAGHEVTVITSRRAYDNPKKQFAKREKWRGVLIYRLFNTGFGKGAKWRRIADFGSFVLSCCFRLCWLPKQDLVVAMTSPPLISFIAAAYTRVRGSRFCYWVMDLNPDEAIAAGWLASGSSAAVWLERISRFSLRQAFRIVVLDEFMRRGVIAKGIEEGKVVVIPPWSHDAAVRYDEEGRRRFRNEHGLENKFVIMYSGNHSPCHPLDTILEAAKALVKQEDLMFCFVGGGSEFGRVKKFSGQHGLSNILCLPYQPMDRLGASLSAADLHLVVMGDPFVGLVHPCKVYNIIQIGSPLLYIGPQPSHISAILKRFQDQILSGSAAHGDVKGTIQIICELKNAASNRNYGQARVLAHEFSMETLVPRFSRLLESAVGSR